MRIVFDHCVPKRLRNALAPHDVTRAAQMGWEELENSELLGAAAGAQFDVLLTVDQNVPAQQNLSALPVALMVVVAHPNTLEALKPLVPQMLTALATLQPRTLV